MKVRLESLVMAFSCACVVAAEPSFLIHETMKPMAAAFTNDEKRDEYSNSAYVDVISSLANIEEAWLFTRGDRSTTIAIIDTGLIPHEDLPELRLLPGADLISNSAVASDGDGRDMDPTDNGNAVTRQESSDPSSPFYRCTVKPADWHGTQLAGVLGAAPNNGLGVAGANWLANLLPVRALGKCGGLVEDVSDSIKWAAGIDVVGVDTNENPADVILVAAAGNGRCADFPNLQSAIDQAVSKGAPVVVPSGNFGRTANTSEIIPASCNNVITVAASEPQSFSFEPQLASYSAKGGEVDLLAPGGNKSSCARGPRVLGDPSQPSAAQSTAYHCAEGTSIAAAYVAGAISLGRAVAPSTTPAQWESLLKHSAYEITDTIYCPPLGGVCGAGNLDAYALLATVMGSNLALDVEVEPNNVIGTANPKSFGNPVGGSLSSSTDMDFFQYVAPSAGQITLDLEGFGQSQGRWRFTVMNANLEILAARGFQDFDRNAPGYVGIPSSGTYYISIKIDRPTNVTNSQYQFTPKFFDIEGSLEIEGNNSPSDANPILSRAVYRGGMLSEFDEDWFAFTTTTQDIATITAVGAGGDEAGASYWTFDVLDGNQELIASQDVRADGFEASPLSFGLPAGTFYLRVTSRQAPIFFVDDAEYTFSIDHAGARPIHPALPASPVITSVEGEDGTLLVSFLATDSATSYVANCGSSQSAVYDSSPIRMFGFENDVPVACVVTAANIWGTATSGIVIGTPTELVASGLPVWLLYEASKPN